MQAHPLAAYATDIGLATGLLTNMARSYDLQDTLPSIEQALIDQQDDESKIGCVHYNSASVLQCKAMTDVAASKHLALLYVEWNGTHDSSFDFLLYKVHAKSAEVYISVALLDCSCGADLHRIKPSTTCSAGAVCEWSAAFV